MCQNKQCLKKWFPVERYLGNYGINKDNFQHWVRTIYTDMDIV